MKYLIASRVMASIYPPFVADLTADEMARLRRSLRGTGRKLWFVITPLDEVPTFDNLAAVKAVIYKDPTP